MDLLALISSYIVKDIAFVLSGFVFIITTDLLYFKGMPWRERVLRWVATYLVSFNMAFLVSYCLYHTLLPQSAGALAIFWFTVFVSVLPVFPFAWLYARITKQEFSVALFVYALSVAACFAAMLIATSKIMTVVLMIALTLAFILPFRRDLAFFNGRSLGAQTRPLFIAVECVFVLLIGTQATEPSLIMSEYGKFTDAMNAVLGARMVVFALLYMALMKVHMRSTTTYETSYAILRTDTLTGLYNMEGFYENALRSVKYFREDEQPVVFCLNVVGFARYNALYGREGGDRLLCEISEELKRQFPRGLFCRENADRFIGLVLLDHATSGLNKVGALVQSRGVKASLSMQGGICAIDRGELKRRASISRAIDNADIAMRTIGEITAKNIVVYTDKIGEFVTIWRSAIANIDDAVEKRWLKAYYQPVVDVKTGELVSFEALARWDDPEYGMLPPVRFIEPLERMHKVYKVDLFILDQFGRDVKELAGQGLQARPISFNISRADFDSCDVFGLVERMVAEHGLPRELVHVEITERAIADESLDLHGILDRFHEMGFEVWMDDFGTGQSSLSTLREYDFDLIKIDMSFLRNFTERSRKVVTGICQIAQQMGVRTLAEGVETEEHLDFLREVGCDLAQGYLFDKPQPLDVVRGKWLAE